LAVEGKGVFFLFGVFVCGLYGRLTIIWFF